MALIPPDTETVAVTLNGVTQNAAIDSQGNFSTFFNTSQLPASTTPYQVTYAYAGDANFNSVSDNTTTTLTVQQVVYSVQQITDPTTGNIEYRLLYNGFQFGTVVQTPAGAVGFRGHPDQSDINAWGTTVQENVYIAGAGVDATGGTVTSAVAGSSGIQVSAGGNVPSASGTVGIWGWTSTITYDPSSSRR